MLDNFPLFSFEGNQSTISIYPVSIASQYILFDICFSSKHFSWIVSIFLWYNVITVPLFGVLLSMCKYSFVWLRLKLKLKLTERWTQNDGKARERERANSNIYFIISGATTNVKANKNLGDFLSLFTNTQFEFKMELQSAI